MRNQMDNYSGFYEDYFSVDYKFQTDFHYQVVKIRIYID